MTNEAEQSKARTQILELLKGPSLPGLGPGPREGVTAVGRLEAQLDAALRPLELEDEKAMLARSLVLLWHDHLDASHRLSQQIETADGSYAHGIMHRREPDYGNAKYWFRRVGTHPCFARLVDRIKAGEPDVAGSGLLKRLAPGGGWDAFAMVDLCEELAGRPDSDSEARMLRTIQGMEMGVLVEYVVG